MREVRHELVMLPYYGVFDNLTYNVSGGKVKLAGQVRQPTLKANAERAVKEIEGVEKVENDIEVLPLSTADDQIRLAVYQAIYGQASLSRYSLQAVPPIHIVVKNGAVTLVGVVATDFDKTLAETAARSVPGTFAITNEVVVEARESK
jgi:hyperosmotically inducible protein